MLFDKNHKRRPRDTVFHFAGNLKREDAAAIIFGWHNIEHIQPSKNKRMQSVCVGIELSGKLKL